MAEPAVIVWQTPHIGQRGIVANHTRFNVSSCGRRFGKTVLGERLLARVAAKEHQPTAWFAPSFRYLLDPMEDLVRRLRPITASWRSSEKRLTLIGGGYIDFWSLDSDDPGRSRHYGRVIVDEAGMVAKLKNQWERAIRPTLSDLEGDAWFFGTPKGHNYFWQLYNLGLDPQEPEWSSWQLPTSMNPYIKKSEIAKAKRGLPDRVFQQEYEAAFIEDAGGVFRHVIEASTAVEQTEAIEGHRYVFGVDWGRSNDFTVIAVIDETAQACVALDRFSQVDYELQKTRLRGVFERFKPYLIHAEENSMGGPLVENLKRQGFPIKPFYTSQGSKEHIIDKLALAFERRAIQIIPDPVLQSELRAYEISRTKTGLVRYSAPDGMHDDCCIALALGWAKAATSSKSKLWIAKR